MNKFFLDFGNNVILPVAQVEVINVYEDNNNTNITTYTPVNKLPSLEHKKYDLLVLMEDETYYCVDEAQIKTKPGDPIGTQIIWTKFKKNIYGV
jgi:hypothetical protein